MAESKKITELTEVTSVSASNILLYVVDSSGSTPTGKKISGTNLKTIMSGSGTIVGVLNDLTDVSASSPNNSDVLTWNSSSGSWVASPSSGGSSLTLDSLTDVSASSPNNSDVLTWNSSSGSWIASAPTGGSVTNLKASDLTTRWEILTVGDVSNPDIVYADGDCIYVEVPI